jgi:hypothetical protein
VLGFCAFMDARISYTGLRTTTANTEHIAFAQTPCSHHCVGEHLGTITMLQLNKERTCAGVIPSCMKGNSASDCKLKVRTTTSALLFNKWTHYMCEKNNLEEQPTGLIRMCADRLHSLMCIRQARP